MDLVYRNYSGCTQYLFTSPQNIHAQPVTYTIIIGLPKLLDTRWRTSPANLAQSLTSRSLSTISVLSFDPIRVRVLYVEGPWLGGIRSGPKPTCSVQHSGLILVRVLVPLFVHTGESLVTVVNVTL